MNRIQDSAFHGLIRIMVVAVLIIAGFASACALGVLDNAFGFGCIAVVCTFASKAVDIYISVFNPKYNKSK